MTAQVHTPFKKAVNVGKKAKSKAGKSSRKTAGKQEKLSRWAYAEEVRKLQHRAVAEPAGMGQAQRRAGHHR